jgi:hypothetical protein
MRSKNSRGGGLPNSKPVMSPDVTLIQILAGGEYVRVLIPSTGVNVHAATGSTAVATALAANVSSGLGDRMLAEVPVRYPQVLAAVRNAMVPVAV